MNPTESITWFDDLAAAKEVAEISGGLSVKRSLELIEELQRDRDAIENLRSALAQWQRLVEKRDAEIERLRQALGAKR